MIILCKDLEWTLISWNSDLKTGMIVFTNSFPNAVGEAMYNAYLDILAGATDEETEMFYNEVYDAIYPILLESVRPFKFKVEGERNVCKYFSGEYNNDYLGKISISEGNIKVGHLDAVPLFRIHRDEYKFVLKNKFSLSFEGKVKKIDDDLIQMNYYCISGIYKRVTEENCANGKFDLNYSDDNIKKRKW
jgi:hypothetical protein